MGDTANDEIDDLLADGAFEIGLNQNTQTMTLMTRSSLLRKFLVVKDFVWNSKNKRCFGRPNGLFRKIPCLPKEPDAGENFTEKENELDKE